MKCGSKEWNNCRVEKMGCNGCFYNEKNKNCDDCVHCNYSGYGDMYCDEHEDFAYVYDEFCPTNDYMWCNGKRFIER